MQNLRIFLASSNELSVLRSAFDLFIRRKNDYLKQNHILLEVVLWENFTNALARTRLQDEYNKAIETCDLFVSVFSSKAGMYTVEEFKHAYQSFAQKGTPLVFTYFAKGVEETEPSLIAFKNELKEMGHFITFYDNEQDFLLQFSEELHRYLSTKHIQNNYKADRTVITRTITQNGQQAAYIEKNEGTINLNFGPQ